MNPKYLDNNEPPSISKKMDYFVINHYPTLIKDISVIDGDIYLVLDYIQFGDSYEIINENPKLRTFKLSYNCDIYDCLTGDEKITASNILDYKKDLISTKGNDKAFMIYLDNEEITVLNLYCYN